MWARIIADALVITHLVFIVFALIGGLSCLWRRWMLLIHLPAAVWACLIEFKGWLCPLTDLENSLRALAGQSGYAGGFVEHHLLPVLYPADLTTDLQIVLGFIALTTNVVIYGYVIYQRR